MISSLIIAWLGLAVCAVALLISRQRWLAERHAHERGQRTLESADQQARRAIEQLRVATRLSGVRIWSYELDGGDLASAAATFVNVWESLGYDPDDLPAQSGSGFALVVVPEDQGRVMAEVEAYLAGRTEQFESEYRVRHKDGSIHWSLARGVASRDAAGRATRFTGASVDVSRLKQVEERARIATERLELAAQLSGLAVVDLDLRGAADPRQAKVTKAENWHQGGLGFPALPSLRDFAAAIAPEDLPHMLEAFRDSVSGKSPEFHLEYRARTPPDSRLQWRLGRGKCFYDESGGPLRYIGVSIDIQEVKSAQEVARRAVEQLRVATELSGVAVWGYELEGGDLAKAKSAFGNEAVMASLGYEPGEVPSDLVSMMSAAVHPEDQPRAYQSAQDCLAGRTPLFEAECRLVHKNGSIQWWLMRGIVLRDGTGQPLTLSGTAVDITQLKQTQQELGRVKERLELAVLGSKACTWDIELRDGQVAGASPVFSNAWELCGYAVPKDPALIGSALSVLLPPQELSPFIAELQAFLDGTAREWERELRVVHADGSDRWHLTRGVVARAADGRAMRFTGASIDITDRKLTEQALQRSEEGFRHTFENAAVGMILTDLEGRFLAYNSRFCEFLGYTPTELVGRSFVEFMVPDEVAGDLAQQRRVVRGEIASFTRDKRYFRKDGAVVWGSITVSVMQRNADGTAAQVMGVLQDISERKALEVAIQKAQTRLERALRSSNVTVYEADLSSGSREAARWTFFNMWEPLGFEPAEMPSDFARVLPLAVHPEDQPAVLALFQAAVQSRSPDWYIEHRVLHRDGSLLWRLSRGSLSFDEQGNVSSFTGTEADITRLKQIEGELSRAREAAEAANRAKDEFLANVSHEIRTPMNAILGMTELALDTEPNEHQRQLLSTVRSAAKNLLGIINDLLDFSKIEAGKLTLEIAPFSLRAAVGDTLRALAVRAQRQGLELRCQVREEVPDALEGDAGRLRQVLMNLVGNAIKFTPQGKVEVDVEVGPAGDAANVLLVFTVRDTGIGIAVEKQAAVFRAFEQEDSSTTRSYGGTGLGLTIAARLAELMGGGISVESAVGRGSTFRFSARLARSSNAEAGTTLSDRQQSELLEWAALNRDLTRPRAAPETAPPSAPALRLVIAEDNELNIALLRELSSKRGYQAQFARDGRAALELALQGHCDLMLLDVHMPELDGFEVVRRIREHELVTDQHLPIIALTARSSARDRQRCLAAGMDDFLSKPLDAVELWASVDRLMARRAPRDAAPDLLDAHGILGAFAGKKHVLEKLLGVFRQSLPEHMSEIRAALSNGEAERLREAAHRMAGSVGTFSRVTARVAVALESAAIRADLQACGALVERLESMCDSLLAATAKLSLEG